MNCVFEVFLGFLIAVVVSEILQRKKNILSAVKIIVITHFCILSVMLTGVVINSIISPLAVLIFWTGAFLFWSGVRDHIENSILMRMVYMLLSNNGISPDKLFLLYESQYGVAVRLEKLERSGFIRYKDGNILILKKGHFVAKVISIATHFWH